MQPDPNRIQLVARGFEVLMLIFCLWFIVSFVIAWRTKALLRCGVIGTATVTFFWLLLLSRASSGSDYDTALTVGLPGGLLSSVAGAPPSGGQMNLPDHIIAALEAEERGAHCAEFGFPPEREEDK
jgi:hypothetical protein